MLSYIVFSLSLVHGGHSKIRTSDRRMLFLKLIHQVYVGWFIVLALKRISNIGAQETSTNRVKQASILVMAIIGIELATLLTVISQMVGFVEIFLKTLQVLEVTKTILALKA